MTTWLLGLWMLVPAQSLPDLEFAMAVEETVMALDGTAPPEPYRGLIERLGSDSYRDREVASRELAAASRSDRRWLFWGRKARDPEARLRSNTILRRLNPCPSCGGTGASRHYREDPCWSCNGFGSAWPYSAFD